MRASLSISERTPLSAQAIDRSHLLQYTELCIHLRTYSIHDEADPGNPDQPPRDRVGPRARAVRHGQRASRDGSLEGGRSTLAQRRIGGAQHHKRRGGHNRIWTPHGIELDPRGRAHDHLQPRHTPRDFLGQCDECIQVPADLLRPAAREQRQRGIFHAQAQCRARRSAVRHRGRAIEQWMPTNVASIPCSRRSGSSNGRITAALVMVRASSLRRFAPTPRLQVMSYTRDALGAGGRGEFHVETGIIDAEEQPHRAAPHAFSELPEQHVVPGNVPHASTNPMTAVNSMSSSNSTPAVRMREPPMPAMWRSGRSTRSTTATPAAWRSPEECFSGREQDVGHKSRDRGG